MFKLKSKLIIGVALILGITTFISCNKDFLEPLPENGEVTEKPILGKKLENPYSVTNMKKALGNLKTSKKSSDIEIYTTHYYVKFKPKNEEELSILKRDTTIDLYDYPLDREVVQGQDAYHDPEIPKGKPTYQYCAVKADYIFPDVGYKILEELFIPEETDALKSKSSLVEILVDEALRITGNLEDGEATKNSNKGLLPSKWRPAGTILVWDDNIGQTTTTSRVFDYWQCYDCETGEIVDCDGGGGDPMLTRIAPIEQCRRAVYKYVTTTINGSYQPVQGAIVRARRFFITHKDDTDYRGKYSCDGEFRYDANYSIIWERYNFEIRKSWLGTAKYDGPKQTGDWNLNIRYGNEEFFANIFKAAHHYYYKNIKGLRRPPLNSFWHTKLRIRAYYEQNSDVNGTHAPGRRFLGLGSAIKIYNPQNNTQDIYATVIHEMAHASHWSMDSWHYNRCDEIVAESWARGVQRELTRMIYPNYSPTYSRKRYTGVVQDMIDGNKTTTSYYYFTDNNPWVYSYKSYSDQVSGYTIRQIEDALINERYWNNWKLNIKNKYNNGTENNLDATFSYWNAQ